MRRISAVALTLTAIVLAACSDNRLPTAPEVSGGPALLGSITTDGCVDQSLLLFPNVDTEVKNLIGGSTDFGPGLFVGDNRQSALSMWENLKKDKLDSRPLQSHIDNEAKFTLNQLGIGGIQDPDGPGGFTAVTGSIRMLDLMFRCTGTTPLTLPDPPAGFNAEWEIVKASIDQQVTTTGGDASVFVPANTLPEGTLLVIVGAQPSDVQVNTPFPMLSNTVDVAIAGGKVTGGNKLTVLVCPSPLIQEVVNARAVLAHQKTPRQPGDAVGTGVEYLDPPQNGNLTCPEQVGSNWRMEKGFFKQRTMQLASYAKRAWRAVTPRVLYAGHAAIGGSSDFSEGFSPLVAVDPFVETSITDVSIPTTTYGETINFTATLRVSAVPATCGLPTSPAVCSWVGQPVTAALAGIPALTTPLPITATLDGQPKTENINGSGVASFSFTRVNAGDNQTATLSFPPVLNEPANAPDFAASNATATYTVNRAPLDVTPAAASKTYGDDNPTLTGTVTGEVYDEDGKITAVYQTTATQQSYISTTDRTYPITVVSIAPVAGSGVLLSNYVYDLSEHSALLTINQRTLGGSAANASRVYGEPNPTFSGTPGTPTNAVSFNDGLVINYSNTSIATTPINPAGPPPAEYLITASLSGPPAENYINSIAAGTLTISPRVLAGGPDVAEVSVVYGDPVPASFAGSLTASNGTGPALVADDGVIATFATNAVQGSYVNDYVIQLTLLGAAASNYNIAGVGTGTLHITRRPLTVTADAASREYGDANPSFTGTVSGQYPGDDLVVTYASAATALTPAGTYGPSDANAIVPALSGPPVGNYEASLTNGTLTITQAPLDIGANSVSLPFGTTYGPMTLTGSVTFGAKNGEVIGVLANTVPPASSTTPVGEHTLIPFLADPQPNYTLRIVTNGILTVTESVQQQQLQTDFTVGGSAIGGGPESQQKVAQVVTPAISGELTEVAFPVACTNGTLIVEIQGVTAGKPNGTVIATQSVAASELASENPPVFRTITFGTPATVTSGTPFAIVLRMNDPDTEQCGVFRSPEGDLYPGGDGYFDARPNLAGDWVAFSARRDLPFRTLVVAAP